MSFRMENLHVAFIMDGNRRWAVSSGKSKLEGHKQGGEKLKQVLEWCRDEKVSQVTLYAMSLENLKRSSLELKGLYEVMHRGFEELRALEEKFTVNFLGRLEMLPDSLQNLMRLITQERSGQDGLILNFCVAYGGRQEIVDACNRAIEAGERVDEESFKDFLYGSSEPDIVIRTGGAMRTSNFLPYQTIYSEWFFLDTYWPAFSREEFDSVMNEFSNRKRNFGK